jgi:hypothetical protein
MNAVNKLVINLNLWGRTHFEKVVFSGTVKKFPASHGAS